MSSGGFPSETLPRHPAAIANAWRLVIAAPDRTEDRLLPGDLELTFGRSSEAVVTVDDPLVSRVHVRLRGGEPPVAVDLGSRNGTTLNGEPLAAHVEARLASGDRLAFGDTVILVERSSRTHAYRRVKSHTEFRARLAAVCERSRGGAGGVALIQIRVEGAELDVDPLAEVLAREDVLEAYGAGVWQLVVARPTDGEVREAVLALQAMAAEAPGAVRLGIAHFGEDGTDVDALQATVTEAFATAAVGGSGPSLPGELRTEAQRVANSSINVLLLGETGSGKEVLAEFIHRSSPRRERPLVRLNCAALSEHLLESELFGHVKGAFTGALRDKQGLFGAAEGGTLLLDEVGELPLSLQAKLLRVVEEGTVRRVGDVASQPVDVRIVAATHRDLEAEAKAGRFRADLYYRLATFVLRVPPLRERPEEITAIADSLLVQIAKREGMAAPPLLGDAAREALRSYRWPGNVRELRNALERAVVLTSGGPIGPENLPTTNVLAAAPEQPVAEAPRVADEMRELEKQKIIEALAATNGNQTRAAALLGMPRRTFVKRLTEYEIPRPRKK